MKMPSLKKLPYQTDSRKIYAKLKHLPWAAFLDSNYPFSPQGRYDIITANPYLSLQTYGAVTTITSANNIYDSRANPFQLLKTLLTPAIPPVDGIPFPGGALGFFSYDLSRQFEPLIPRSSRSSIPDMMVGIYDWAIITDHHQQHTYLSCCHRNPNTNYELEMIVRLLENDIQHQEEQFTLHEPLTSQKPFVEYEKAFNTIKQYLYNGDCYQVNLTYPFAAQCQGSAWQAYQAIRAENPMPYAAFLNFNDIAILSLSPERFIHAHNQLVIATPIKGTCKRDVDPHIDTKLAWELKHSEKNLAENLMIVDLLRNDLSKICSIGTIKVPKLFQLDSYTGIHHLSSTITGQLSENQHTLDALQACFPSGSITGAPKIRSMQIIDEVEGYQRNIYCGSIGYIGFDGNLDSNIAIRTLVHKQNKLYAYAGGAIVVDSLVDDEYQESLDKIAVIRQTLLNLKN